MQMILKEETFSAFGYLPSDLALQSHKKVLAKCDDCGVIRVIPKRDYRELCHRCVKKGKYLSVETHSKLSEAHKGIRHTKETKHKMSKSRKGDKNPNFGKRGPEVHNWKGGKVKRTCQECGAIFSAPPAWIKDGGGKFCSTTCSGKAHSGDGNINWKGGEVKSKCQECGKGFDVKPSAIKNGRGKYCSRSCCSKAAIRIQRHSPKRKKTKPEVIFEDICKWNNLPFHYVGDGQLWIGKKGQKQLNPDFIEATGKKVCVEVMGDYWHSPLLNKNMKESGTLVFRKKHYKHFKWHPIFIWESDLKRRDAEAFVLNVLKNGNVKI